MSSKKHIIYAVSFMMFIDAIGIGIVFPILPKLLMSKNDLLGGNYISSKILYGLTLSIFPFSSIFGMPIFGIISDKYGRIKIIAYGLIGLAVHYLIGIVAILTSNLWLFLFSRLLGGFLSGTYSVGYAAVSDLCDNDKDRIYNLKLPTIASFIGVTLGPGLSLFISNFESVNQLITPFIIAFLLSVINVIFFLNSFKLEKCFTKEPSINKKKEYYKFNKKTPLNLYAIFTSLMYVYSNRTIRILSFAYLLFQCGLGVVLQSLSLQLAVSYGYTPGKIGEFFMIMGICMMVGMYFLQPIVSYYVSYKNQVKVSLVFLVILLGTQLILLMISRLEQYYINVTWISTFLLYVFIPIITLGFTNLFASSTNKDQQGVVMGGSGQIYSISWFASAMMVGNINYELILFISILFISLSYVNLKKYLKNKFTDKF